MLEELSRDFYFCTELFFTKEKKTSEIYNLSISNDHLSFVIDNTVTIKGLLTVSLINFFHPSAFYQPSGQ